MLKNLLVAFVAIISSTITHAQFVVKDVLAVDPQASIFDPEYNTQINQVCWKSDDNSLWISDLNPVTHLYEPSDGKKTFITGNLSPNADGSWNGPEWMLSNHCTQIVYNKTIDGIQYPGIATQFPGCWFHSTLFQYPNAAYSMATANYSDSSALFLFETIGINGISWVRNTDLGTSFFRSGVTLGFFARDNQQICCATSQERNPGFIEVASTFPYFTLVSHDTIGAPFMWNDPATNKRLFMYRTNGNKTLKVFQELTAGQWVLYNQFASPLPAPFQFITSPEPFTIGGRSYISFMAAQSESGKDGLPAQIWIAGTNPENQFMRCVSDTFEAIRTDPEPVVFSDSAFIYYTHVPTDKKVSTQYSVRKCDTGLSSVFTPNSALANAEKGISVFPNPGKGRVTVQTPAHLGNGSKIELYDLNGRMVFGTRAESSSTILDLQQLPAGNYILNVSNQGRKVSTEVAIMK